MTHAPTLERIRHAVGVVGAEIDAQLNADSPGPWTEMPLWTELACCVLSSQVPYAMAQAAAVRIHTSGLLLDASLSTDALSASLANLLRRPLEVESRQRRYRFPDSRASQLAATVREVRRHADGLADLLAGFDEIESAREWFIAHAPGLGPKQASMFLRNVGASYDLAVLDRHVINYMMMVGLTEDPTPARRMAHYRRDEVILRDHAAGIGLPVGVFDWAIWIVMRVVGPQSMKERLQ